MFVNFDRSTNGLGQSFKGALLYHLHDKRAVGEAERLTTERATILEMRGLATTNPERAWLEMMNTAEASNDLKRRAGLKVGKAGQKPVFSYHLSWNTREGATVEQMHEAARESLKLLGLADHQALIVLHTDTANPHVHVIANRVNPDNGVWNDLGLSRSRLKKWCIAYAKAKGWEGEQLEKAIQADREAKEQGKPRVPKNERRAARSREEHDAMKRGSRATPARDEAAKIKAGLDSRYAAMRASERAAWGRRQKEARALDREYRAAKAAIYDAYKPQLSKVYAKAPKRGQRSYLQLLRDAFTAPDQQRLITEREGRDWSHLSRRQYEDRREFYRMDRTAIGAASHAIRYARAGGESGGLSSVWALIRDPEQRRRLFDQEQAQQREALKRMHKKRRDLLADPIKARRAAELKKLADDHADRQKALAARHAAEERQEAKTRADYATDKTAAWESWRDRHSIDKTKTTRQGGRTATPDPLAQLGAVLETTRRPPSPKEVGAQLEAVRRGLERKAAQRDKKENQPAPSPLEQLKAVRDTLPRSPSAPSAPAQDADRPAFDENAAEITRPRRRFFAKDSQRPDPSPANPSPAEPPAPSEGTEKRWSFFKENAREIEGEKDKGRGRERTRSPDPKPKG